MVARKDKLATPIAQELGIPRKTLDQWMEPPGSIPASPLSAVDGCGQRIGRCGTSNGRCATGKRSTRS